LHDWALSSSEQLRAIIAENYKASRRDDDLNVAISVQPWGMDGERRKYWLIEGQGMHGTPGRHRVVADDLLDDTPFRLYREKNAGSADRIWISIAGTIDEIRKVARELEEDDGTKHAMALKAKIDGAILRFEEGEKVCLSLSMMLRIIHMMVCRNARNGNIGRSVRRCSPSRAAPLCT